MKRIILNEKKISEKISDFKGFGIVVIGLLLIGCVGCVGKAVTRITSDPSGAIVTLDKHYIGDTPFTYTVKSMSGFDNTYTFLAIKDGYRTQTKKFQETVTFGGVKSAIPPRIHFTLEPASGYQE